MAAPKKRGVRIPYVVDARGNTYDRHAIDVRPHPPYVPPLKCKGCGIPVSARSSNADNSDSRSSHYFKLPGSDHAPTCSYDLKRRGGQLVDASQGTVVRRDGQWRLKCPPLERPGTRGTAKGPSGPSRPTGQGKAGGTRPVSKLRGSAIASARRIVELLEDFGQDPEAVAEFAAVAPGGQHSIAWDEFCFGRSRVDQLAQALIDGTARQIPHAVWGPATTADAVAGRSGESYVVQYVARNPLTVDGRHVKLRVALRCNSPEWIAAGNRSGKFLGYGYWTLFPADLAKAGDRGWIELQLWVKEPWQVERWDIDEAPPVIPVARQRSSPPTAVPTPNRRVPEPPDQRPDRLPAPDGQKPNRPEPAPERTSTPTPAPDNPSNTPPPSISSEITPPEPEAPARVVQPPWRPDGSPSGRENDEIRVPPMPPHPPSITPPSPGARHRGIRGWLDRLRRR
ncbi:hypothetical protein ACUN3E_33625 [Streptomyces sp. Ju416(a)]|uniref:hypothetical protein n=1 Tax=Streptomyces sp. Ju416(a) TaxID=3446591 RepID=UPI00403DE7B6